MSSLHPRLLAPLFALLLYGTDALAATLPNFTEVRARWVPSEARLLDRRGEPLAELRVDPRGRRLEWLPLEALSPALQQALIASEDKRFYQHDGVDWRALASAAWDNVFRTLEGRRPRGASTLTMQLAGLLDPNLHMQRGGRTLAQKWDQARAARDLERRWRKAQILEAYLNLAPFRGELQGVAAAARGLFGKDAGSLDAREAAILVALLRGPNASPALVGRRACVVAAGLDPAPTCKAVTKLAADALAGPYRMAPRWNLAPHLAQRLLTHPGEVLQTTLDASLQRRVQELLARSGGDGAAVVLDNAGGEVLAWVGAADGARVDGVLMPRRPGDALQPFLYELALEQRWLTAASMLDAGIGEDDATSETTGPVSVRAALAASLEAPAQRTLALLGPEPYFERLRALGFAAVTRPAEGSATPGGEVTLLALANAYRALANGGEWRDTRLLAQEPAGARRRVMDRAAAFIVTDILAQRTVAIADPAPRPWSAVNCGSGRERRNHWCMGVTERYTVAVWLGGGAPRDGQPAAPTWRALAQWLHRERPSLPPLPPAGVVQARVRFEPPTEAERDEWYLAGTQQTRIPALADDAPVTPRIAYPAHGTLIALDPDQPAERQPVSIAVKPPLPGLLLSVDGQPVALRDGRALWPPTPGRHRLALLDAEGKQIEALEFVVHGGARRAVNNW